MASQGFLLCKSHQNLNVSKCFSAQLAQVFCRTGLEISIYARPKMPKKCKMVLAPRSSSLDVLSHVMVTSNGVSWMNFSQVQTLESKILQLKQKLQRALGTQYVLGHAWGSKVYKVCLKTSEYVKLISVEFSCVKHRVKSVKRSYKSRYASHFVLPI